MNWRRAAGWAAAALFVLAVLWFGGVGFWASRRLAEADREWASAFGIFEDLQKRYPKVETNATAKRVEELAKAAGYDLRAKIEQVTRIPRTPAEKAEAEAREAVSQWMAAQLQRPDPSLEPLPAAARAFLEERSDNLAALEETLLTGPRPIWAFDVTRPRAERETRGWANYLGLQRALIARALTAELEARHAAAGMTLGASWILNEAVGSKPDMLAQILSIAVGRLQVGALRKAEVDGEIWRPRLAALDFRGPLIDEIVLSTTQTVRMLRGTLPLPPGAAESGSLWSRLVDRLGVPWWRFSTADYEDAWRAELLRLRDSPLSDQSPGSQHRTRTTIARTIFSIEAPNIRNGFLRADRLVVDAELTSKILEVKELRKKNGGRWPSAVPGIEACSFPGASWRYEVSPEGRMSLSLDRELASPYPRASIANPLHYSSN